MSGHDYPPDSLPPGFDLVSVLGMGGGGLVSLARQCDLGRLVAVKIVPLAGAKAKDAALRLRREGQVIASLRHPNIVEVYELLVTPAGAALVMEYLPGGDLGAALDYGRLNGRQLVNLLNDVAVALDFVHRSGYVHRDVKPANVLITEDGRAKLADFGLARLPRASSGFRTQDGRIGTSWYMAPEQILRPEEEVASIDAYAFAVLAYHTLTGAFPFDAVTRAAILYAHLHDVPVAPCDRQASFPREAGQVVLAGLSKLPAKRPTPLALVAALRAVPHEVWTELTAARPRRAMAAPTAGDSTGEPGRETTSSAGSSRPVKVATPPIAVGAEPLPATWAPRSPLPVPPQQLRPQYGRAATWLAIGGVAGLVLGLIIMVLEYLR